MNSYLIVQLIPIPSVVCVAGVAAALLAMYWLGWCGRPLYKKRATYWTPVYRALNACYVAADVLVVAYLCFRM